MMRLPWFGFHSPKSIVEAAKILAAEGSQAMLIAGGTDLIPNMKRRHQTPAALVSLRQIEALKKTRNASGAVLGAGLTLNEVVANAKVREQYAGLWQAAAQVATADLCDTPPHFGRTRQRDHIDPLIADQRITESATRAGDNIQHARG